MFARMEPKIAASVLNADLGSLREVCSGLEQAGIDAIQWDVMDGHFVPNITIGHATVASCRSATTVTFEAHLMVANPDAWISAYIDAGCEWIIVHEEAAPHLHRTLSSIRAAGGKAGVALNPSTPLSNVQHVMDLVDLLLIMTVEPGFGGQSYIASMETKIADARRLVDQTSSGATIEVDGGISIDTICRPHAAGADRFIVGSALFKGGGPSVNIPALKEELGLGAPTGGR